MDDSDGWRLGAAAASEVTLRTIGDSQTVSITGLPESARVVVNGGPHAAAAVWQQEVLVVTLAGDTPLHGGARRQ